MKTLFTALFVAFAACVSLANEPTPVAAVPQSVVVADAVPAVSVPADCCSTESCAVCQCRCRNGLFGHTVARTRAVTRTAVRAAVVVPLRVVAAPFRCFRARRGCCR